MDGQKMEEAKEAKEAKETKETKETKRRLPAYLEYCLTQRYLGILKRIYEENYTVVAMRIERILENGESTWILQDRMVRLTEEPIMIRLWLKSRKKIRDLYIKEVVDQTLRQKIAAQKGKDDTEA